MESMQGSEHIVIPDSDGRARIFKVNLERTRVYWDYYKSMFLVFSFCLMALMVCATLI
ncbi:MAG: hypothetical protein GF416_00470, partial [Candidatus Altiarchaeales archaeon]|nr:hypothetical protein [Candidatus Altiarchaeales archaeon]MBD3415592.1 hypothetical protein [Candidatus Altiarchaeales archaeon]